MYGMRRRAGYGYESPFVPSLGVDITDGDPVENLGDGMGIDLRTDQLEVDLGGIDFPF